MKLFKKLMQSWQPTRILGHASTAIQHGVEKDSETELSLAESELLPRTDACSNRRVKEVVVQWPGPAIPNVAISVKTGSSLERI